MYFNCGERAKGYTYHDCHVRFQKVFIRTVNRQVARLGYNGYRQVKKPILTKQQKKSRLDDCIIIGLLKSGLRYFGVTKPPSTSPVPVGDMCTDPEDPLGPQYTCGTTKHPDFIMVRGCLTVPGVCELIVLPKTSITNQLSGIF